jgi:23S rRNA pseudouridine1911/1915/1917 synthase
VYFAHFVVKIPPRLEKLFAILYEDAGLLVVNKPAGLVCHPTKGDEFSSLISRARLHLRSALNLQPSTHLVNRLDRETSGVVLIAKNSEVAGELGKILETRAVQKEYLAIVHGLVRDDHGLIDAPLGRDERSRVAIKDCVRPDGAPSQTEYWVERRFNRPRISESGDDGRAVSVPLRRAKDRGRTNPSSILHLQFSLLRVIPRTGRKHQIRIHLAHLGHPIVGDKLYGGDEDLYLALVEDRLTPEQRARLILPHHALHARAVRFSWRGLPREFSCAPEPWFTDFFDAQAQNF